MKSKRGLLVGALVAAGVWWACIILSAVHFGFKAAALAIIAGLAVLVAQKMERRMDEAGDAE